MGKLKKNKIFFRNHYGLHDLESENISDLKLHLSDAILTNGKYCERLRLMIMHQRELLP